MNKLEKLSQKYSIPLSLLQEMHFRLPAKKRKYLEFFAKNSSEILKYFKSNLFKSNLDDFDISDELDYDELEKLINNLIDCFDKFERCSSKLSKKDIYQYSFKELIKELETVTPSISDLKKDGCIHIYEDDKISVIYPITYEAHKLYAAKTQWCTTSDAETFKDYNCISYLYNSYKYNFVIILIDKSTNKKYAISMSGSFPKSFFDGKATSNNEIFVFNEKDDEIMRNDYHYDYFNSKPEACYSSYIENLIRNNNANTNINLYIPGNIEHAVNYAASLLRDVMYLTSSSNCSAIKKLLNNNNNNNNYISSFFKRKDVDVLNMLDFFHNSDYLNDASYVNIIKSCHDAGCNCFAKNIKDKKIIDKKDKKIIDKKEQEINLIGASLEKCNCVKFNNLKFLNKISSCIKKDLKNNTIHSSFEKINFVINEKIKAFDVFSEPKEKLLQSLLEKNNNNIIIINNKNLTKNEMLFLQVSSKDIFVKKFCKSQTQAPDELASEILKLKNINSIKDLCASS